MQFIALKFHIYLAAQNHYSSVSLYLVNPKLKADLHYIRTVEISDGQYNLPLIPMPSQPCHLITCSNNISCRVMQINLNYEKNAEC